MLYIGKDKAYNKTGFLSLIFNKKRFPINELTFLVIKLPI